MRTTALALALVLGSTPPALAQSLSHDQLEAALKARDQEIADLEKRVAALEAERAAADKGIATLPASPPAAPPSSPASTADEAELRALTRGLVQRGALVLPKGAVEVVPSLSYAHSQSQGLVLVDTPEGISTVSDQRQRDDSVEGRLTVRLGLPWRSQIEVRAPFDWKSQNSALGDGSNIFHQSTYVGDLEVELSHQFLSDSGWRPDLVAGVSARFPTGQDPYKAQIVQVASGGGDIAVTGRLTAFKAFDPLVLFGGLAYTAAFSHDETFGRVRPGNVLDWQMGGILSVSPSTSVSFAFVQDFRGHTSVDGKPIAGSDGVAAVAQFGLDQSLSSRALLDVTVGIGVTRDAPDYQVMVSLPIRFR